MNDQQKNFVSINEKFKVNLSEIKSSDLKLGVTLTKRNQELIDILPSKNMEYYKVNRDTNPATNRRISKSQCGYICSEIETISIQDWIGIIYKLNTTVDGFIVPQISMPSLNDINIPTKNYLSGGSSLYSSDSGKNYLIKPDNRLYNILAELKKGDKFYSKENSLLIQILDILQQKR